MAGSQHLKYHIREVLGGHDRRTVMDQIGRHRPRRVINVLIGRFCDTEALIRWRAVAAAGGVVAGLAESDLESARVIMRRLMWMLNDESGGIGWGVPETMGETMAQSPSMAAEYAGILCSYIHPRQNCLEHPVLQRGLLWGLGRLAGAAPERVEDAVSHIATFLESEDPYHRGLAAWAIGNAGGPGRLEILFKYTGDETGIAFFDGWHLRTVAVGELARQAVSKISRNKEDA